MCCSPVSGCDFSWNEDPVFEGWFSSVVTDNRRSSAAADRLRFGGVRTHSGSCRAGALFGARRLLISRR